MRKYLLFLSFVFFSSLSSLQAQVSAPESDDHANVERADSTETFVSEGVSADSIRAWKKEKQFAYMRNLDSLLKGQQKEEPAVQTPAPRSISFFDALFGSGIVQAILWILAIGFVGFILYRLFISEGAFRRVAKDASVQEQATEEEIVMSRNYDALIHEACKQPDYRAAVRYLFLKTLQKLSERSLVIFSVDKTNSLYVKEVPPAKQNEFAGLVLAYEYVWYGKLQIDKEQYEKIESRFTGFLQKV
ncbi:MAG: hypothetical protein JWQ27_783 [Ferruginibacter sp.]|nr:hypothetical protein [Ferruginibacter sp.]